MAKAPRLWSPCSQGLNARPPLKVPLDRHYRSALPRASSSAKASAPVRRGGFSFGFLTKQSGSERVVIPGGRFVIEERHANDV